MDQSLGSGIPPTSRYAALLVQARAWPVRPVVHAAFPVSVPLHVPTESYAVAPLPSSNAQRDRAAGIADARQMLSSLPMRAIRSEAGPRISLLIAAMDSAVLNTRNSSTAPHE